MSTITPASLYKTAAVLYGFTVPGHVVCTFHFCVLNVRISNTNFRQIMGYQVVYPALAKIPKAKSDDRIGEIGADNSWKFVTTSLAVSGR